MRKNSVKEAFPKFITNDFLNFKYLANYTDFKMSNLLSAENSKISWKYKEHHQLTKKPSFLLGPLQSVRSHGDE